MAILHVHGLFIFFNIFLIIFPFANSSKDSEALLKLKRSFTNSIVLDSWTPETEPCAKWVGILCQNGIVYGLRLGYLGLSGNIDIDALASLSGLRSIALMSNSFSGKIPDFQRIGALKALYISNNEFSGEIPSDYFSKMAGLKKVWLSRNNFSGPIPSSLAQISQLMELHLENNQFSGTIPAFEQKTLISLDLSNNSLEGEIPPGLEKFGLKAFEGNSGLCGGSSGKSCQSKNKNSNNHLKLAMWFLAAFAAVLLAMVIGIFMMGRRDETFDEPVKENLDDPSISSSVKKDFDSSRKGLGSSHRVGSSRRGDLVMINDDKGEFGMGDLMKSAAEVLGNGALGSSYKAVMANGLTVVVKRIKEMSKIGREKFDAEMRKFASLRHKNVLTPLAYHYRKDEKLLVYEYQHKGSLLFLLHSDHGLSHSELNWPVRYKIIQGITRGLGYLHKELSSLEVPHGNLKSSNILLGPNYDPLLVDYGFCSLISGSQAAQVLTAYKSPEAILQSLVSPKCDVFCLGIIILEILTGKYPSQYLNNPQGGTDLVQWTRSAIAEGREVDLLDPDVANATNFLGGMIQLLHIAAACTESNPDYRLDLREAIRRIETISGEGNDDETSEASQSRALGSCKEHSWRRHDSIGDQSGRKSISLEIS
ncbi:Serine/threonine protein kinase [Handroanthus impetiginosus]|uniref:Serine/threonine protein kinase n=1 Tax=Handroanthus impetiginosus TaxID=429701 RepID=A0A2G9GW96_9LAMI|nr:Serine/threonine protein kinase [Handroanthus impetiginosus]